MDDFDDHSVTNFEQTLLTVQECFVYKVPPLRTASGHRAEDWGLDKPIFTGCLKVFQTDTKLKVSIYRFIDATTVLTTPENITLFAECHIEVKPKEDITAFVDAVIDSSRYYVVKIQDPKNPTRSVFIGIGFREREVAFDFKNALNDYVRYVDRMAMAEQMAHLTVAAEEFEHQQQQHDNNGQGSGLTRPVSNLAIKEGDKIKVPIKGGKRRSGSGSGPSGGSAGSTGVSGSSSSSSSGLHSLRPPPPPGAVVYSTVPLPTPVQDHNNNNLLFDQTPAITTTASSTTSPSEDEWSDFETVHDNNNNNNGNNGNGSTSTTGGGGDGF
eukprot:gene9249-19199_t